MPDLTFPPLRALLLAGALLLATGTPAKAGAPARAGVPEPPPAAEHEAVSISLDEAVQIALAGNHALRASRLDVENAEAQIREARGGLLPQVSLSTSYTRNIQTTNPFAGSEAGGLFSSFGAIEWLAYNEQARTDDDPATHPISLAAYQQQHAGTGAEAPAGSNLFGVPNQVGASVTITQPLYNAGTRAALQGAEVLQAMNEAAALHRQQETVAQVRQAFYQALLAQEQTHVVAQSVTRTQETAREVMQRVSHGTLPRFQQLSAEVELANLQTRQIEARNQADAALDQLKLVLGLPADRPLTLRGALDLDRADLQLASVAAEDAVAQALDRRADVQQAALAVELQEVQRELADAPYEPTVSAFANLGYNGNVPDGAGTDLFSTDYWSPSVNAGVRVSWNVFSGGRRDALAEQHRIAIEQAELQYEQLTSSVQLEVERALRDLRAAEQRIQSQEQNIERAELNYEYAAARVQEGVSNQLELRDASQQLDQSRLNYVQAVYDYLVAQSTYEAAVGTPVDAEGDARLLMARAS